MNFWRSLICFTPYFTLIGISLIGSIKFDPCDDTLLNQFEKPSLRKFEVIFAVPGNPSCLAKLNKLLSVTTIQFATHPYRLPDEKILEPLIVLIFPETIAQLMESLTNIAAFYTWNSKNTEWNPSFFVNNPLPYNTKLEAMNDPVVNAFAQNVSLGSEVYFIHLVNNSVIFVLEAYSIRTLSIVDEVDLGSGEAWIRHLISSKALRRSNFRKGTVIASGMDDPEYPLATKFKVSNETIEFESGFEVEFYHYFRDGLNFSEVAVRGTGYVRQGPNGTLTGYAVQIESGVADIAIGASEFLEYRFRGPTGISYVHPIFHSNVIAFFKQPPASSVRNIFTQTFTVNLWISVFFLWIFLVVALRTAARLQARHAWKHLKDEQLSEEAAIWATGVLCQQGWHFSPISTSMKITFYFGALFGLLCYIAYSAALVSILSVEVVPIRTFNDLLTEKFLITSDSHIPTAKVVVQDLEDRGLVPVLDEGVRNIEIGDTLQKLMNSKVAIVTIPDSFYPILQLRNYTEESVCSTVSEKVVGSRPLKSSAFVRRGSPLKEYMNIQLLFMQERGIKARLLKQYILRTSILCLQTDTAYYDNLGLRDVFTAFVLLLFGFVLSSLVAFGEKGLAAHLLSKYEMWK